VFFENDAPLNFMFFFEFYDFLCANFYFSEELNQKFSFIVKMKELRLAINRLHAKGIAKREIARLLDVPEKTVRYDIKRYEETGSNDNRKREATATSRENVQRAKKMIKRNRTSKANSSRKLSKKLGISPTSAWKILRKELKLKPFKYLERQKLTDVAKQKRNDRSKAMLQRFSKGKHRRIVFSDEKLFDIQQVWTFFS
jgi:transposase